MKRKYSTIKPGASPAPLNPQPVSDLLDEKQAAQFLGVKVRTMRLWRLTRHLPHLKISSRVVRYRQHDLDGWLNSYRTVIS
jgi:predicted DNA-binding transcriptional regulator AlpA